MISFDVAGTNGFSARVELSEEPDADLNRSTLEVRLYILSATWRGVPYWLQGQVTGRSLSSNTDQVYIGALNTPVQVGDAWSLQVDHEPDGTGAVTISVNIRGYSESGSYGSGWKVEGSRTVALTPIALASTVSVTEGAVTTIAINRRNSSYSHLLGYSFGELMGFITDEGQVSDTPVLCTGTVISFSIPEAFYLQLPESASGSCSLTCITMDGEKQVGSAVEALFTVKVPESYGPVLTPNVTDINPITLALTGDAAVGVRFMSQLQCTAQAQGQLGAAVVSLTVDGNALPAVVEGAEKLTFQAMDTRGYVTQQVVTPKTVPYVLLTANGTCSRVSPTSGCADLTVRGNCFWGSFGKQDNSLTLTASVDGREYPMTVTREGDSYHARVQLEGLSYEYGYTVTVTARDALMTVTTELQLGRGVPVFDWSKKDFAFHVPITAPSVNGIRNPALKAWPVGAVILMTPDPKDFIGGKWEHFTIPSIDLDAWRRLQGADVLGTAVLGELILGTEE